MLTCDTTLYTDLCWISTIESVVPVFSVNRLTLSKSVVLTRSRGDQYRDFHSVEFNSLGVELTPPNLLGREVVMPCSKKRTKMQISGVDLCFRSLYWFHELWCRERQALRAKSPRRSVTAAAARERQTTDTGGVERWHTGGWRAVDGSGGAKSWKAGAESTGSRRGGEH